MHKVLKYNIFKAISMLLTMAVPVITLISCSDFFIHRSDTAISIAGLFLIVILALIFKNKIMENLKTPSVFIICLVLLILIIILEKILLPIKYICIATLISTFIDELTFKKFYKNLEANMPENYVNYKHLGFIFTSSKRLENKPDAG